MCIPCCPWSADLYLEEEPEKKSTTKDHREVLVWDARVGAWATVANANAIINVSILFRVL